MGCDNPTLGSRPGRFPRLGLWLVIWGILAGLLQVGATAAPLDQVLVRQQHPSALRIALTTNPIEAAQSSRYSSTLLEQYVLLSLSTWELSGRPLTEDVRLQVYEMLDSPAALGLYSLGRQRLGRQGHRLKWGLDAASSADELIFWKGNYFFELKGDAGLEVETLREWVSQLTQQVEHPSVYPMTVVQLPQTGLDRESIRFYLSDEALGTNPAFPTPLLGVVGFEDRAEVTSARYQPQGRTLFLFGYPTAPVAEERFAAIQNHLRSVFSGDGIYLKRSGLLISLIEAPEAEAQTLLDRVRYTATVRWIYEKDTSLEDRKKRREELVTFFGIITTSLLFTGFFILVVLVAGAVLGICRYQLLEHFPGLRSRDDMIRLDLASLDRNQPNQPR